MTKEIEIELLLERIDSMNVANEELRERLAKVTHEMITIAERSHELERENKELSAKVGRLLLHLQQGVEL